MARRKLKRQSWNELPDHYDRRNLETPEPVHFRSRNVTDGRGANWTKGMLLGHDHHCTDTPCPIVYSKEGGFRTLNLELWEIK